MSLILILAFVFILFSFAATTHAQPTPTVNYQGKLSDNTGAAVVDGDYNVRFWLFQNTAQATTSAIWTESLTGANQVSVVNGLFSVMLGSTSPLTSVDFNQPLYLGVEIGGTGTPTWDGEMLPRKPLGTVPAAFQAEEANNAQTLGGVASTSFLRSDVPDSMDAFLTLTAGAQTSDLIVTGTATTTNLVVGSDFISSLTGVGLTITGNALSVSSSSLNLTLAGLTDTNLTSPNEGDLFSFVGGEWVNVATSSLGFIDTGATDFLSLTDTPGSFNANRLFFTNGTGDAVTDSADLTFDGTDLNLAGSNTGLALQGVRMFYASTTNDSIAIGEGAGLNLTNTSNNNVAIGYQALNLAGPSVDNVVALGYQAFANASGTFSNNAVAIGNQAGALSDESGIYIGYRAGYTNGVGTTGGYDSIFIGNLAGLSNTSGDRSVMIGEAAGSANTTGGRQVFIGDNAGGSNISGGFNTYVGFRAGLENVTGDANTFLGYYAGLNLEQANYSVALGSNALNGQVGATGGSRSVALGYQAANTITTGTNNILIGYRAADSLTTGANNLIIGYDIEAPSNTGSNQLNLGNLIFGTGIDGTGTTLSSGNVGIGTTSPSAKLDVWGNFRVGTSSVATLLVDNAAQQVVMSDGTFDAPGITFASDRDAGFWLEGADDIGVTAGGMWTYFNSTYFANRISNGAFAIRRDNTAGSESVPTYSFYETGSGLGYNNTGMYAPTGGNLAFSASGTEVARFNETGEFGIGTDSPNSLLDLSDIAPNIFLSDSDNAGTSDTHGGAIRWRTSTNGQYANLGFLNNRTLLIENLATGSNVDVEIKTEDDITFDVAGAELMRLDGGLGNVGIGTTSPYARLSVAGDLALTGGIYDNTASRGTAGMVMQTTGSGVQWVATSSLGFATSPFSATESSPGSPYDISMATFDDIVLSVAAQEDFPKEIIFNNDGTVLYVLGANGRDINAYTLSVAYDINTAVFDSVVLSIGAEDFPTDIMFNDDGTILYVIGSQGDDINAYSLSVAYDISTATFDSVALSVAGQDTSPFAMLFNNDGTVLYVLGTTGDDINAYSLSVAYDISTATFDSIVLSVSSQDNFPTDMIFSNDGSILYIIGDEGDDINAYSLSVSYDISTATFDSIALSVAGQDTNPRAMLFNNDGTVLYVVGLNDDEINAFTIPGFSENMLYVTDTTANFGIGTSTANSRLTVDGTSTFTDLLTLSGNAANIALGSNWLSGDGDDEGVFVNAVGNVGIGTSSPSSKLDVWGDFRVGTGSRPLVYANTAANQFTIGTSTVQVEYSNSDIPLFAISGSHTTGNPTMLLIKEEGLGQFQSPALQFERTIAPGDTRIGTINYANTGSIEGWTDVGDNIAGYLRFLTDGPSFAAPEERMRITSSGNVGIGTTSPYAKLSLNGDFALTGGVYDNTASLGINGMVMQTTGSGVQWVATSTLGFGGGTTFGTDNQIPVMNAAGNDFEYSNNLTFDNSVLTVTGDITLFGGGNSDNFAPAQASFSLVFDGSVDGPGLDLVWDMETYDGDLYVAFGNGTGDGDVYKYDGSTWTLIFAGTQEAIRSLEVFEDVLYMGQGNGGGNAAVFTYTASTSATSTSLATIAGRDYITDFEVYKNRLYAFVSGGAADDSEIYQLDADKLGWTRVHDQNGDNFMQSGALVAHNGVLYAIYGDNDLGDANEIHIYETPDGTTWTEYGVANLGPGSTINDYDRIYAEVFDNDVLIAGSRAGFGSNNELFFLGDLTTGDGGVSEDTAILIDLTNWTDFNGFWSMHVNGNRAYLGSESDIFYLEAGNRPVQGTAGAAFWDYRHINGFNFGGGSGFAGVGGLAVYQGSLYAGFDGSGSDIYRISDGDIGVISTSSQALNFVVPTNGGNATGTLWFEADVLIESIFDDPIGGKATTTGNNGYFKLSHVLVSNAGAYDVAEDYPTVDTNLKPGELLMYDDSNEGGVRRATREKVDLLTGVSSANPGFLLSQGSRNGMVATALVGRVPVLINNENGNIAVGDSITISSIDGEGKVAEFGDKAVGYALESYEFSTTTTYEQGDVMVYVSVHTALDEPTKLIIVGDVVGSGLTSSNKPSIMSRLRDLAGRFMDGVLSLTGLIIGSEEVPTGITIYDVVTGDPYCSVVANGETRTMAGTCEEVDFDDLDTTSNVNSALQPQSNPPEVDTTEPELTTLGEPQKTDPVETTGISTTTETMTDVDSEPTATSTEPVPTTKQAVATPDPTVLLDTSVGTTITPDSPNVPEDVLEELSNTDTTDDAGAEVVVRPNVEAETQHASQEVSEVVQTEATNDSSTVGGNDASTN